MDSLELIFLDPYENMPLYASYAGPPMPIHPDVIAASRLRKLFAGDEAGFEKYQERVRKIDQGWQRIGGPEKMDRYFKRKLRKLKGGWL